MARHRKYDELVKHQVPVENWSVRMPAYTYTGLCSDPALRKPPKREKPSKVHSGVRPVKSEKICLICQKRWPADCGRKNCDCEKQGHLYELSTYYQPRTGGRAGGKA